jgi:excisionase family DNA binding protein
VNEEDSAKSPQTGSKTALGEMIGEWLDWKQAADQLGVSVNKVRTWIRDHHLAAAVPVAGEGQKVPAELIQDGQIVHGLPGLLTMMSDHGFSDLEMLEWIFTPDESLPGRPIDALRENRGAEVKRRAQVLV